MTDDGALAVLCGLWLDPAAGALCYAALRRDVMARLTPINNCINCRYCASEAIAHEPIRYYCTHPKLRRGGARLDRDECASLRIPEWCPLPVAKEE